MELAIWGATDVGLKRQINQDTILVNKDLNLYIVADGMGGHKGGEVASALAVKTVETVVEGSVSKGSIKDVIKHAYREASGKIFYMANIELPNLKGMGTTMVLALFKGRELFIGNVGDSRAYLHKDGRLWQLTEDHSLINEQLRSGVITEDQLDNIVGKNVITRSVGFEDSVQVDIFQRKVESGEGYLLCSDGLCGMVSDSDICKIIDQYPPDQVVSKCIELAKQAGGDDNISVIYFTVRS